MLTAFLLAWSAEQIATGKKISLMASFILSLSLSLSLSFSAANTRSSRAKTLQQSFCRQRATVPPSGDKDQIIGVEMGDRVKAATAVKGQGTETRQ